MPTLVLRGTLAWRLLSFCFGLFMICFSAHAQNPYTICIGDRCDHPAYIKLDCSFATAHPDDTDDQAAKFICMVRNNYTKYTYVRTGSTKGGRCGAVYVQVRCQSDEASRNATSTQ
jgi:hypothetical protein